jgi:octaprenyl-diphosphate synthase
MSMQAVESRSFGPDAAGSDKVLARLREATRHGGAVDIAERLADVQAWLGTDIVALEQALMDIERDLGLPLDSGLVDGARLAARHLVARPGKRVRPLCVMIASRLGRGADADKVRALAVASELVHAATLLHDDVIDEGTERRGVPTARRVFGNSASVLAGDHLLVRALRTVAETGVPEVLPRLLGVLDEMITAESIQLAGRITPVANRDVVLSVMNGKTGSLFRWAMEAGGLAAGLDKSEIERLGVAGGAAGIAFQLVDDVLDLSGDAATIGKGTFVDLCEGKLTWPLVVALERDPTLHELVRTAALESEPGLACSRLAAGVRRTDALAETIRFARAQAHAATAALAGLPDVSPRHALELVVEALVARVL